MSLKVSQANPRREQGAFLSAESLIILIIGVILERNLVLRKLQGRSTKVAGPVGRLPVPGGGRRGGEGID